MSFEVISTTGLLFSIIKNIAALIIWILLFLLIFKKNRKKTLLRMVITGLIVGCSTWGEEQIANYIFDNGIRPENNESAEYLKDYVQGKQEKNDQNISVAQPQTPVNPTKELGKYANAFSTEEEISSESTESVEQKEIINKIVNYNGKHLSLGDDLDVILDILGDPLGDNPNGDGFDIEYEGLVLHFTFNDSSNFDYHDSALTEIVRYDIFKSKQEVFSYLGEQDEEGFDQELNMDIIKYIIDDYIVRAYVSTDNELRGIGLSMPGE